MVREPKPATLKRYGLSLEEWRAIADSQGGVCFVCRRVPANGRLCIDHEHVKGWRKMPPEERKRYTRGLLCFFCNHYYVGRAITPTKALRVYAYLTEYDKRKAGG